MNAVNVNVSQADRDAASQRLMIVRLTISRWGARRFDKKASDEVAKAHGAGSSRDVGRFNKILVDLDSLRPIEKCLDAAQDAHYRMTAPWADDGARVLPVELYFDYAAAMSKARSDLGGLVSTFVNVDYPAQVEAAKTRLNGLFNAGDYPSSEEVRTRFRIFTRFEPLPNADDARVWAVGAQQAEELRDQIAADVRGALEAAQMRVCDDLMRRAREFVEKVGRYQAGDTGSLRETALTNLTEIVDVVLRGLNVTGDERLDTFAKDLQRAVGRINVDALRTNETLRKGKLDEVNAIARKFSGAFGGAR